jgi:hypothetical protein
MLEVAVAVSVQLVAKLVWTENQCPTKVIDHRFVWAKNMASNCSLIQTEVFDIKNSWMLNSAHPRKAAIKGQRLFLILQHLQIGPHFGFIFSNAN